MAGIEGVETRSDTIFSVIMVCGWGVGGLEVGCWGVGGCGVDGCGVGGCGVGHFGVFGLLTIREDVTAGDAHVTTLVTTETVQVSSAMTAAGDAGAGLLGARDDDMVVVTGAEDNGVVAGGGDDGRGDRIANSEPQDVGSGISVDIEMQETSITPGPVTSSPDSLSETRGTVPCDRCSLVVTPAGNSGSDCGLGGFLADRLCRGFLNNCL